MFYEDLLAATASLETGTAADAADPLLANLYDEEAIR